MYNRYIPQPDGSFSRSRVEKNCDPPPLKPNRPEPRPAPPHCPEPEVKPDPKPECKPVKKVHKEQPITGFLQNLLPNDLDTGDLIVILLLLLLAGDCEEDRSTAMLTLAIYLFM